MTDPGSLAVDGPLGWLQLLGGLLLFLAPGLAAADRLLGLRNRGWWFAPVFSFTLLPLGAIVLDLVLQVRITTAVTVAVAVAWTLALTAPRWKQVRRLKAVKWRGALRPRRPAWTSAAFLLVLAFVWAMHTTPHWPGPPSSVGLAYPHLIERAAHGVTGSDFPFPVHVDEHNHLAQQYAISRQGTIDIDDPYTGEPPPSPLFSISGFRQERGFDLALVQAHQLTGLEPTAQARFLPALQATLLAALVYATLAPTRGAWVSALFVAAIPTTVHFLGPGFLVPSAFTLSWVATALHVSLRAKGGRRLAALALLETGAFFLHLVMGTLVLATAALATTFRKDPPRDRLVLLAVCFLPLVWIGPVVAQQVADAVSFENSLSFQPGILYKAGVPLLVAALAGLVLAFAPQRDDTAPLRVFGVLALAITASLAWSIAADHHSDATYTRLVPTWFLCVGALAGWAVGWLSDRVAAWTRQDWARLATAAVLALVLLAPAVKFHLGTPYYRVFDDGTWQDGRILGASNATGQDVFLADPWRAPIYNGLSGALPYTVLNPGSPPAKASDWSYYLDSGGANAAWLHERAITYVIAPVAPNAPSEHLGGHVYRILPA